MLPKIFQQIKNELVNGYVKKGHPFRYFTLITAVNNIPKARTVVLRKVNPSFELLFYTDRRSNKVQDIKKNENTSALFYHPGKFLQININGCAILEEDKESLKKLWEFIPENSRKDYTTKLGPGTPITNPNLLEYEGINNFCAIKLRATKIEFLQLKKPNHLRAEFKLENDEWKGQFLVP